MPASAPASGSAVPAPQHLAQSPLNCSTLALSQRGFSLNLLFLCKRHPQQRDLLTRPYGRHFYHPTLLAARGHAVTVALLSYRGLPSEERQHSGVRWFADDLLPDPSRYWRHLRSIVEHSKPDWIIAGSDTYFGILAARLGRGFQVPVAIDAYDNFESYIPWAKPLHHLWRRALGECRLVTAPGPQLLARLKQHARQARSAVLPMAADPAFVPVPKSEARRRLGLPQGVRLVGYCGSLFRDRGAEFLFEACARLSSRYPDLQLVGTGRIGIEVPPQMKHLGYLPDADVPAFMSAIDVACVTATPNPFSNFAYPAKLYEALACGTPVVASGIEPIRWILGNDERLLAPPGDTTALAARLERQLLEPHVAAKPAGWDSSAALLEEALRSAS